MSDTSNRVKKIVVEHLGVDEAKVTDNASFIDDLGADSLDTVELVDGVRGGVRMRDTGRHGGEDSDCQGCDQLHRRERERLMPSAVRGLRSRSSAAR